MNTVMPFTIIYMPAAIEHLQALSARERSTVMDSVDEQLIHEPAVETHNRKLMRPNPVAPWELRVESLRVYYDIDASRFEVNVLAVGKKERNRLWIGGQEVQL